MKNSIKHLIIVLTAVFLFPMFYASAQEGRPAFLMFEWMKVDDTQWSNYMEIEEFWTGIHRERIKAGDILGWDLWSLQPSGSEQGAQYLVVHVFESKSQMFNSSGSIMDYARKAYPNMSDEEINAKLTATMPSRDIAWQNYIQILDKTETDFQMKEGIVAHIGFMKALNNDYEDAEINVFKPLHQKDVDAGRKGDWQLLRVILPWGSDTYLSHFAINMYENMQQWVDYSPGMGQLDPVTQMAVQEGLKTRDMKMTTLATLEVMLR